MQDRWRNIEKIKIIKNKKTVSMSSDGEKFVNYE